MTTKVETSRRGDWINRKGEIIPCKEIGGMKVPSHVVDLANWLEGDQSLLGAGELITLIGDRSAATISNAAMQLMKISHVHRYVLNMLMGMEIDPHCDKAVLENALRVIVKRWQLEGR